MSNIIVHKLTDNDLAILKYYTKIEDISPLVMKCMIILSNLCGGLHHAYNQYGQMKKINYKESFCFTYLVNHIATCDPNTLTRLVFLCHDMAVRLELQPCNFRYFKMLFHEREREGDFSRRHPSIEQALENWRKQ